MREWTQQQIKALADRIRAETHGAMLYGEPVNWDNFDMAVVAAYWLGQGKAISWPTNDPELLQCICSGSQFDATQGDGGTGDESVSMETVA